MKKGINMYPVPKKQFKLWLEEDSLDRLTDIAHRFGRGSAQQVVEELIALYLPVWTSVNTALDRAVQQQTRLNIVQDDPTLGDIAPESTHPLPIKGSAPAAKRKIG
jgi:hypothetical protein